MLYKTAVYTFVVTLALSIACSGGKQPAEANLIGHWPFDEITANGGQTPDVSGNGRHGRLHGQRLVEGSNWQALIDRNVRINEWMHIAVVYDEGEKTAGFLNGDCQHLVKCGLDFSGAGAAIGAQFPPGEGNLFTSELDDFRIYSRALGIEEIQRLCSAR